MAEESSKNTFNSEKDEYIKKQINQSLESVKKTEQYLEKAQEYYDDSCKVDISFNSSVSSAYKEILKAINSLNKISYLKDKINPGGRDMTDVCEIKFNYKDGILKIILPSLLPARIKNDQKSPYTYSQLVNMYGASFKKYSSQLSGITYNEKVFICINNYLEKYSAKRDNDNYEIKFIIDLITAYFLFDDSPQFCSIMIDSKIGEYEHSEIELIPESYLMEYLKKKK